MSTTCLDIFFCLFCLKSYISAQDLNLDAVNGSAVVVIPLPVKAKGVVQAGNCLCKPKDCEDILLCGQRKSDVYRIWPISRLDRGYLEVFCDMETDGGGWTVIQRRGDFGRSKDFFFKDWEEYKHGFGDVSQDFWIGNDPIFALTNQKQYSLRFDLKDLDHNERFAVYDNFWIDSEDYKYTLHVSGYHGDAGNSFNSAGSMFSTKDEDNDSDENGSCANEYKGAWWYITCHYSNLNGLYLNGFHSFSGEGINWHDWLGSNYSLPYTEMKIRRIFFTTPEILDELTAL